MRRPSALMIFGLSAFAWMVVLTLAWTKVSPWTSYPVAALTQAALGQGAPLWVRSVRVHPGHLEVDSAVAMPVPSAGGRLAEATIESDPGRYAYGLPVILALLLAARGQRRIARGVAGYLLLLPLQTFSAVMFVLMQIALYAHMQARVLGVAEWQVEAVVYGYQLGSLVVPTLGPILLWLWLDRQFVADVIAPVWHGYGTMGQGAPNASASASDRSNLPARPVAVSPVVVSSSQGRSVLPEPSLPAAEPSVRQGGARRAPAGEVSSSASAGLPPRS